MADYYFINAMVTICAVIFIAGAHSMVITTKIKELQYYNKFNEIFVLSLLILFINMVSKAVFQYLANRNQKAKKENKEKMRKEMKKRMKKGIAACLAAVFVMGTFVGCGAKDEKVVIYSNADDEAIECMKQALDENGYKDQYMFQTFGTSELGGKL